MRSRDTKKMLALIGGAIAGLVVLTLLDHRLWEMLTVAEPGRTGLEQRDWFRFLRILGFWPTWMAVGGAMATHTLMRGRRTGGSDGVRNGIAIVLASGASGLIAEIAKLVIRRGRPGETGIYTYDWPMADPTPPLGTVSSHAAVAFGAAFMLARIFPGSGWVMVPLAAGCGLTRLLSGAHFSTDVFAGAICGFIVASIIGGVITPRRNVSVRTR